MKAFVYVTTNLINEKKYLGKHNGKSNSYLGSGKALKKAIEKYGKENFQRKIIKECLSDKEAYELEKHLSEQWNVVLDSNWYNMKIGGDGFQSGKFHPMFQIPKSQDHKKKLSLANQGNIVSAETKNKISVATSGKNNPMYGKFGESHPAYGHTKTAEGIKNISEAQKVRIRTVEQIEKFRALRIGKGMGIRNSMANPENRKKISLAKIGKKRHYREDGSFYMG